MADSSRRAGNEKLVTFGEDASERPGEGSEGYRNGSEGYRNSGNGSGIPSIASSDVN